MTDKQFPDEVESALREATRDFRRNAEKAYAELDRLRASTQTKIERLGRDIEKYSQRLADQTQRAVTEGSKAAAVQVHRTRKLLAEAQSKLDDFLKSQAFLSDEFRETAARLYKASVIDEALSTFEQRLGAAGATKKAPARKKKRKTTGRKKASAKKKTTTRKKAASRKKPAAKKKAASKKKPASRKKAASKKKTAAKKKSASKKKPASRKKTSSKKKTTTRKKAASKKKAAAKKKSASKKKPASRKKTGSKKKTASKKKAG